VIAIFLEMVPHPAPKKLSADEKQLSQSRNIIEQRARPAPVGQAAPRGVSSTNAGYLAASVASRFNDPIHQQKDRHANRNGNERATWRAST
jgi:hypothetical protein